MKFALGRLVATSAALDAMETNGIDPAALLHRHSKGDWGELCPEDRALNDAAVSEGNRIFSSYKTGDLAIWIITEADRSSTCILLPEDY